MYNKNVSLIYVKGSGWDMSNLNENGMPCLELKPLLEVEKLKKLDDKNMVNYLRKNLIDTTSPRLISREISLIILLLSTSQNIDLALILIFFLS